MRTGHLRFSQLFALALPFVVEAALASDIQQKTPVVRAEAMSPSPVGAVQWASHPTLDDSLRRVASPRSVQDSDSEALSPL